MDASLLQQLFSESGFMLGIVILLILAVYWLLTNNQKKSDAREERLNMLNETVRTESKEREEKISAQLDIALKNNSELAIVITKDIPELKSDVDEIKDILTKK